MRHRHIALLAAACLLAGPSAQANDSSASLGTGGLVLTKSADIRMASEDLSISRKRIAIRYEFANDSGKDVDTIVAFPLPDIATGDFYESPMGTMTDDPVNFVGFEVRQNGAKIPVQVEQRAIFKGRDVTAVLKGFHVPVNIIHQSIIQSFDKVPPATRKALLAQGLAEGDGEYLSPRWTVRTKIFWKQHFPAGKTIVLEQRYQPVVGQSFFTEYEYAPDSEHYSEKTFCMDKPAMAAAKKKVEALKASPRGQDYLVVAYTTQYILKTAGNWKGPIGSFHLTLDKDKPGNVLSLCWNGELKKTGPTTFEFTRTDFAPAQDLNVLVLE